MSAPAALLIPEVIWQTTLEVFADYATAGVEAGCFWYGIRDDEKAVVALLGVPRQRNYPQHFEIDGDDLAALTEAACASGLVVVAQLHSHPGNDVNQSPWDDLRVVSQNVFSLVLPNYGEGGCHLRDIGVHRFQQDAWTRLPVAAASAAVQFLPNLLDTR